MLHFVRVWCGVVLMLAAVHAGGRGFAIGEIITQSILAGDTFSRQR